MAQIPAPGDKKPRHYAAKDYDHPDVHYWVKAGGMLWWAAAALGLACMYDTLHQSLTFNAWPPYWPLYYLYYPILTAYAGARYKEKRVRRAQQYEKYTGEFFVYGWLAIAILIFFAAPRPTPRRRRDRSRSRGRFRAQDVTRSTGYSIDRVYAGLGPLVRDGVIEKQPGGWYA